MKFNKSSGQAAKMLLALIIVIFVAILIAYLVIKSAEKPVKPPATIDTNTTPKAIYESTADDIKVTFQESYNFGSVLRGANTNNKYQKDLVTTEKYIMVTVGAQNQGKIDTPQAIWDLGNIIDSDGRNFIANSYNANPWLPANNGCGSILKPDFTPTSCTRIYEVAKGSNGLKLQVFVSKKDKANDKYDTSKKDTIILDLIVNNK